MPIILATQEVEMGGLWFKTSLGKNEQNPISKNKLGIVMNAVVPARQEVETRGLEFQGPGKTESPI
jgi:hypothetical protein